MGLESKYIYEISLEAATDLSDYVGVVKDADGKAAIPSSAGAEPIGFVKRAAKAGESVTLVRMGEIPVVAGESAISDGDAVELDTNGHVVTSTASSNPKVAEAMEGAGVSGDYIKAFVTPAVHDTAL